MPVDPAAAQQRLEALLAARPGGFVREGDDLVVEVAGRRCYLRVLPFGPDAAVVQVMVPLLAGAADRDELHEAVATAELPFGRLLVIPAEDGSRSVELVVRFHADQLDAHVVDHQIAAAATAADRLDPELESRFGATWTLEGP